MPPVRAGLAGVGPGMGVLAGQELASVVPGESGKHGEPGAGELSTEAFLGRT